VPLGLYAEFPLPFTLYEDVPLGTLFDLWWAVAMSIWLEMRVVLTRFQFMDPNQEVCSISLWIVNIITLSIQLLLHCQRNNLGLCGDHTFLIFDILTNLINVLLACYNSEALGEICVILIRGWNDFNTLEKMQEGLQKTRLSMWIWLNYFCHSSKNSHTQQPSILYDKLSRQEINVINLFVIS